MLIGAISRNGVEIRIMKSISFILCLIFSAFTAFSQKIELAKTKPETVEQIIYNTGFCLSYNQSWLISNWVAWELTKEEAYGKNPRFDLFIPDPKVNGKSATTEDYSSSVYERGHMIPSAEVKWNTKAMEESSYYSNICPQSHNFNSGIWKRLEKRCQGWAKFHGKVWICTGPIVNPSYKTIGTNKVVVPAAFFKVVCTEKKGKYHSVGFIIPNGTDQDNIWDYLFTVDEVEAITGHDFFFNLPDSIERDIEARIDSAFWRNN